MLTSRYLYFMAQSTIEEPWADLARDLNVMFHPAQFLVRAAYLLGTYRGMNLGLTAKKLGLLSNEYGTTLKVKRGETLALNLDTTVQQLTSTDIPALLTHRNTVELLPGELSLSEDGRLLRYEEPSLISRVVKLRETVDAMCDILDNVPAIVAIGGQAMAGLRGISRDRLHEFRQIARTLMTLISEHTTAIYQRHPDHLFCRHCLTRWIAFNASPTWSDPVTYYGCRSCNNSQRYITLPLVAVLDRKMDEAYLEHSGLALVNWAMRPDLFDFEAVGIIDADDQMIERFVMRLGNDTDPNRPYTPSQMRCLVRSTLNLSQNSERLLARTFGSVERLSNLDTLEQSQPITPPYRSTTPVEIDRDEQQVTTSATSI